MTINGTFTIKMTPEAPYDVEGGITLGRVRFDKTFVGGLTAQSVVQMTAARTAIADSAGYVAVEKITGTVDGKVGSFVVLHTGIMNRGTQSLTITIVPDSGTDDLVGISGSMDIKVVDGVHHYTLHHELIASRGD